MDAVPLTDAKRLRCAARAYLVGHPLVRELARLYSARGGEYRVIYEVRSGSREVVVLRAQHRRDVYRSR